MVKYIRDTIFKFYSIVSHQHNDVRTCVPKSIFVYNIMMVEKEVFCLSMFFIIILVSQLRYKYIIIVVHIVIIKYFSFHFSSVDYSTTR